MITKDNTDEYRTEGEKMKAEKRTPSVNNSIQTELSGGHAHGAYLCTRDQFFIFQSDPDAVTRIDRSFSSNVDVNELSEALELVENTNL